MFAVGELLIVAGLSGVGKSELLARLAGGTLPAEITAHLPPGSPSWPVLSVKVAEEWLADLTRLMESGHRAVGASLHVDTATLLQRPARVYRALEVLPLSQSVTLVEVFAPWETVADRLVSRMSKGGRGDAASMASAALLVDALKSRAGSATDPAVLRSLATGAGIPATFVHRLHFYRDPKAIERIETAWRRALADHCGERDIPSVQVESLPEEVGGGFRLVSAEIRRFRPPAP